MLCLVTSVLQDNILPPLPKDAFCNWCLENAALDHPSSQAGLLGCLGCEQVPVELVMRLQ